jgi:hypothetical protein
VQTGDFASSSCSETGSFLLQNNNKNLKGKRHQNKNEEKEE